MEEKAITAEGCAVWCGAVGVIVRGLVGLSLRSGPFYSYTSGTGGGF